MALADKEAMLDLMGEHYRLPHPQALAMASMVVDLRVTQIANGVPGVHAVLSYEAIREDEWAVAIEQGLE
ncbi:MAG TPA: hypothetical protein VF043_25455 [Ktedonobacteraceae bacterium]